MAVPSAKRLLDVWDQASRAPAWQRSILLLAASDQDLDPEGAALLPVGERDARLLRLREVIFGSQMTGVTGCPQCTERLELTLNWADFDSSAAENPQTGHRFQFGEYAISFRLPTTLDLAAANGCRNIEEARLLILQLCVLSLKRLGEDTPVAEAPEELIRELERYMAEIDPNADVRLALACPACEHQWNAPFDIGSFFWTEFNAWAHRRLEEVHRLASAYGWSEADILELSPLRRRYYLEAITL
jgi:hypothetical protein